LFSLFLCASFCPFACWLTWICTSIPYNSIWKKTGPGWEYVLCSVIDFARNCLIWYFLQPRRTEEIQHPRFASTLWKNSIASQSALKTSYLLSMNHFFVHYQ
jgi:hypothetical protein